MRRRAVVTLLLLSVACATAPRAPGTLARVNGEEITTESLRREFARHHMALDKIMADEKEVRRYVEKVIDRRLLLQEAARMGIPERADVREIADAFRADKMRQLLLRDEIDEKVKASDADVRAVYDTYDEVLQVHQLVVRTREEAEALRERLAAGADFEALARERSIAPSAKRGGMAIVVWGGDPETERVVFALKEGETSAAYRSALGFEIDRLEKRAKQKERPAFEKLASRIRATLERRRRAEREPAFLAEVRGRFEARALECPIRPADLRAALEKPKNESAQCATWRGGTLSLAQVARRVVVPELEKVPAERQEEVGRTIVRDLLDQEVLRAEAEARGYARLPEVVEYVRGKEEEVVEDRLLSEHVLKDVKATDEEVKAYYEGHRDEFVEPARYVLAQILVDTPEVAKEVGEKLAANQPFEELARSYSRDAESARRGGVVREFEKRELKGPFEPVLALQAGEVSAPLKTQSGYHLVKVLTVRPDRVIPFEEAKESVRRRVLEPKVKERSERWVGTLRAAARIEIDSAAIEAYSREKTEALVRDEKAKAERAKARGPGGHGTGHGGMPGGTPPAPSSAAAAPGSVGSAAPPDGATPTPDAPATAEAPPAAAPASPAAAPAPR